MSEQPVLEPLEERHIDFYGDDVTAVLVPTEAEPAIYVPIRPICDYLGLAWSGQYERLQRDEVLSEALRGVRVTRTPGRGGGTQELLCLPLELLPGWLFGITTNRIKDETLRQKIVRYRRECYRVLWDVFKQEILPPAPTAQPIMPAERSGAKLAYEIATAVQHLARQQMEMEQRLEALDQRYGSRIDAMARFVRDYVNSTESRLSTLELQLNPQEQITEAQAAELALAVKAVGQALSSSEHTRNGYQLVYGEIYRRYRISSYKNLPQGKFNEVLNWLHQWHAELPKGKAEQG